MQNDTVPVLVGAGDIADCKGNGAERTARILDTVKGTIFIAGDAAYRSKKNPVPMRTCYAPTWGRHRERTRPTPGNHEYDQVGPGNYFSYFGDLAGSSTQGYYSYQLGTWHVVALNTNLPSTPDSPQANWLRADLDAHLGQCTIAYMHHPRFSSGPHGDRDRMDSLWRMLYAYGVSVVVAGHDHIYERFTPLDADGAPDSVRGMRQFVVGTGGASHYKLRQPLLAGSEASTGEVFGVLKVSLLPGRYRWQFIPVEPNRFDDRGESACHPTHAAN